MGCSRHVHGGASLPWAAMSDGLVRLASTRAGSHCSAAALAASITTLNVSIGPRSSVGSLVREFM